MNIQSAAAILVKRRQTGEKGDRLPQGCRPSDITHALAIQQALTELWCEQMDDSVGAWKCGLPSPDKVVLAPIYTRTIDSIPPISLWPMGQNARIEPELAFFLGVDLPPRIEPYSEAEIDAAIVRTHLALELIDSRYSDPKSCSFPEMLADGLVNQGLFIGPEVNGVIAKNASSFVLNISYNGENRTIQASHPTGNPRAPLYWLVNFLREQDQGLVAGQAVITGSYAGVIEIPLEVDSVIEYQGLGDMNIRFRAKG